MPETIDPRDVAYTIVGLALLGLTLQPALDRLRWFNLPFFYVLIGAMFGWLGMDLVSPLDGGWQSAVTEHAAELIVIISLAGAGLAIDTPASWRSWNATWRLLMVAMPLTIAAVALFGVWGLGLSIPGALLLAAGLAPTDPVLARSVAVSPPGEEETDMEVALTAEAGLNDGLAFPFVYLAVHAAALGVVDIWDAQSWIWTWFGVDLIYRVGAGILVGYGVGWVISRIIFSPIGDGSRGAWNAVVVILSATLLSYGITEGVDGYGFLAVFVACRASRSHTRGTEEEGYEKFVHHGAEQLEAIMLAVLLLWLGTFLGTGALAGLTVMEVVFALALIFLIRPAVGLLALLGHDCSSAERYSVSFFGIRGMGSVFYIAYAQNHANFADIEAVWRIAAVTILASIAIHGYGAKWFLDRNPEIGDISADQHDDGVTHPMKKQVEGD